MSKLHIIIQMQSIVGNNDNEIQNDRNQQDYGMRIYDPRVGRFLSVDPLTQQYPYYTPYQFAGNMPIWAVDFDGLEPSFSTSAFKFVFGSPKGYSHPRTALDYSLIRVYKLKGRFIMRHFFGLHIQHISEPGEMHFIVNIAHGIN